MRQLKPRSQQVLNDDGHSGTLYRNSVWVEAISIGRLLVLERERDGIGTRPLLYTLILRAMLVSTSFLLLVVMHLLLVAWHLFLVASCY